MPVAWGAEERSIVDVGCAGAGAGFGFGGLPRGRPVFPVDVADVVFGGLALMPLQLPNISAAINFAISQLL